MSSYSTLCNYLDELGLVKVKEHVDDFLEAVSAGKTSATDLLCNLFSYQIDFRTELAIYGCVKVANFPYLKEIKEFDFSFQPTINKK